MPTASLKLKSSVPLKYLREVILDFAKYPDIFDEIRQSSVLLEGPPVWEVAFELWMIRSLKYSLSLEQVHNDTVFELRWSLIEGFFHSNSGSWRLEETPEGTDISYQINVVLDTHLPASIVRSLTGNRLPKLVNCVVAAAEARAAGDRE
jgi:hypothetical protein